MTGTVAQESGGGSAGKARSLAIRLSTKLLHSAQGMGKGLRYVFGQRAARRMGSGERRACQGASKKGLYSARRGVYQDWGRVNQILIQVRYGTYVHITSSGEGRRRKCRNERLENLYQKAPCRGVLRGYQRNRLAERGEWSGECLRIWQPLVSPIHGACSPQARRSRRVCGWE